MKVAILQSNYMPWKGYFDLIDRVNLFIFHDDLQYTKNDWRNRNKIATPNGLEWLSIPVGTSEKRLICEVEIKDHSWQKKHYDCFIRFYRSAPFFEDYRMFLEEIYLGTNWSNLSELNQTLIQKISTNFLGIKTQFEDSRKYSLTHKKEERVLELLKKVNATSYLSGPAAKDYINPEHFSAQSIELEWMSYEDYPPYIQVAGMNFNHGVTILDLLMNVGPEFPQYMLSCGRDI